MKSYFVHAHVELDDGTRIALGKSYEITDEYFNSASGTDIIMNATCLLQDLFTERISVVESFCITLDNNDDDDDDDPVDDL